MHVEITVLWISKAIEYIIKINFTHFLLHFSVAARKFKLQTWFTLYLYRILLFYTVTDSKNRKGLSNQLMSLLNQEPACLNVIEEILVEDRKKLEFD